MAPKKTDTAEKRTTDARVKRFWVYRFRASGRPIIYVYSAILYISKFTDHVITAKYPYDEIPDISK